MTIHTRQLSGLSNALLSVSVAEPQKIAPCSEPQLRGTVGIKQKREHVVKATRSGSINSPSSHRIRAKLLNSLGIETKHAALLNAAAASMRRDIEPSTAVLRGQHDAFDAVLKADHGKPDRDLEKEQKKRQKQEEQCTNASTQNEQQQQPQVVIATSPGDFQTLHFLPEAPASPTSSDTSSAQSRGVCFDATVKVHPIPARSDYSNRMQAMLWTPNEEIQQNAARNQFEFAAEEWDYTKVVDDEDMVVFQGERVHPIHFMAEEELKEYFKNILDQQKQQQALANIKNNQSSS